MKTWFLSMFIIGITIFIKSILFLNTFVKNMSIDYEHKLEVHLI